MSRTSSFTPPTLDEYRTLNLTRPLTDDPIGANDTRRKADAEASRNVSPDPGPIDAARAVARSVTAETSEPASGNDPRCGTDAGYAAHGYRHEEACDACKLAHARRRTPNPKPVGRPRKTPDAQMTRPEGRATAKRLPAPTTVANTGDPAA